MSGECSDCETHGGALGVTISDTCVSSERFHVSHEIDGDAHLRDTTSWMWNRVEGDAGTAWRDEPGERAIAVSFMHGDGAHA